MLQLNNIFQKEHEALIKEFSDSEIEAFKNADCDLSRIKLLYPTLIKQPVNLTDSEKNYGKSIEKKTKGNSYFAKGKNEEAIVCYNSGIILCPHDTDESQELLALLFANRSACFYELKRYQDTIADIDHVLFMRTCPEKIKSKLYLRKANSYKNMKNYAYLAGDIYKMALKTLNSAELNESAIELKKSEINAAIEEVKYIKKCTEVVDEEEITPFKRNSKYVNASTSVTFAYEDELGRYAKATENIDPGQVVVNEAAHCAVLASEFVLKNCQYCLLATDKPLPCEKCAHVIYCSIECKQAASNYHKFECNFQPTLFASGASINCSMAIRIIAQRPLSYFQQFMCSVRNNSMKSTFYNSDEYACVYNLCRNEKQRKPQDYFPYTVMAIYLLRLLKTSSYFSSIKDKEELIENEILIGSLILHNLQILQFNAHEISELREAPPGPLDPPNELSLKSAYIGGGLYPTLALFNHSCDPGIVRYNVGTKMVVKTIKFIKKGEPIYENYGPIYSDCPRSERRSTLNERYWFQCTCTSCVNNWPMFKDMAENVVKIRCSNKNCSDYFYLSDALESAILSCSTCKTNINILTILKTLAQLEVILPKAEELYLKKKYHQARKIYLEAIKIYYKYTVPPFPDLVKIQQRLRTCIVSEGNKGFQQI